MFGCVVFEWVRDLSVETSAGRVRGEGLMSRVGGGLRRCVWTECLWGHVGLCYDVWLHQPGEGACVMLLGLFFIEVRVVYGGGCG